MIGFPERRRLARDRSEFYFRDPESGIRCGRLRLFRGGEAVGDFFCARNLLHQNPARTSRL
jgi:hypothetical protein